MRIKWFPLDIEAISYDDRIQQLTKREQCYWLGIILAMFRSGGDMPDDIAYICNATGLGRNEALKLKTKLEAIKLLRPDGNKLYSPRLRKEHDKASRLYDARKKAALAKWAKVIDFPQIA